MNTTTLHAAESAFSAVTGESDEPLAWTWHYSKNVESEQSLIDVVVLCYQFLPLIWLIFLIHKLAFEGTCLAPCKNNGHDSFDRMLLPLYRILGGHLLHTCAYPGAHSPTH